MSTHRAEAAPATQPCAAPYRWEEKRFPPVKASVPKIPNAEFVNDDELCMICHEDYFKYHRNSVHRDQSCEKCHGPGSEHIRTRGKEPGLILSFKKLKPAESAEACLACHEENACSPGAKWRVSAHAHAGVSCTSCHKGHYNVPAGTAPTKTTDSRDIDALIQQARRQEPAADKEAKNAEMEKIRAASQAMGARNPQTCLHCHDKMSEMLRPGHAHHVAETSGCFNCTTCHDPHGNVTQEMRTEKCLKCHKGHANEEWFKSKHANAGLACVNCHNPHTSAPKLGAANPNTCYQCHQELAEAQRVAHPHQICGAVGFQCATCHNPHGNIRPETRTDLCLQCHKGHPVMGFVSSAHAQSGVACTDCHNPHPCTKAPLFADIQHMNLRRPKRLPMSVNEPYVCYRCHQKTMAEFQLPSHHPVVEGKMTCSDCHDPHGNATGNLKEPTVNLVCYKCHADKQGPFVYEHPPVTENCAICHNPHGTVANNLLRQPTTFLCLRCHAGHRGNPYTNIDNVNFGLRPAFYTDCTQCHSQVHGSNEPNPTRRGARLQR